MGFYFIYFFSVWLLSVLRSHSFFFIFHPATTANDLWLRRISIPDFYPLHFFPILILEKEPVFPFLMLSGKQGYYWYHFYNVFGITRSLSGIKPGTSYTWSQHSTTRLSRRRCKLIVDLGQNYISKIKKLIISMI